MRTILAILEILIIGIVFVLPVSFIVCTILFAVSKRFGKWADGFIKYADEYNKEYQERKELREREKLYKKIHSGKYDSHTWQYYAQKNGFYPEDEPVD